MSISALPTAPTRDDPDNFSARGDALMTALPTFVSEANALAASMNSVAAGTALAIPYTFSATTTDADPGAGFLRLGSATQNTSTVIRLDLVGADTTTWTSVIDTFGNSTSTIKGQIRLVKLGDPTKWLTFDLGSVSVVSGYRNLIVSNTGSSAASPFAASDSLVLLFTRTGDVGTSGTVLPRDTSITTSSTPTPDGTNTDQYCVTALASSATFGAPAGTPINGQKLMIRVKDNGTARALSFNAIYRAGTDLAFPSTTVANKTLYMGFIYNSADTKWDLTAVLNNI